jgi:sodium/potassium-transporting ATPase subunit alpha
MSPPLVSNVAFFSTNCTEGVGRGVVVRTGDQTAIGVIATNTTQGEKPDTLMKQELERFVKIISGIAIGIGLVFFIIAVIVGMPSTELSPSLTSLCLSVSLSISSVPLVSLSKDTMHSLLLSLRLALLLRMFLKVYLPL